MCARFVGRNKWCMSLGRGIDLDGQDLWNMLPSRVKLDSGSH